MSDARRPRRRGRASAIPVSPAALGVVKVDADFTQEYPDGNPLITEVVASLIRTGQATNIEIERAMLASFDASQSVLTALAVIEGAERNLTPSDISQRTLASSGTMTGTLDTLEYNGWIRRIPNPDDRRSVYIEITDEGQAVCDRFLPGMRLVERALVAELTNTELATLLKLLAKFLRSVAAVAESEPIPLEGRRNRPQRRG